MSTTLSEKSWNSSEDYEDDNSSTTTSSVTRRISGDLDIPGGVITTHCVSSVIKPGSKQNHDPLQFVKIHSAELSKKAVEQIRLAEEVKITKEKIKEVEEEWQNNLLNWKSKRRQSRGNHANEDADSPDQQTRKVKTFSEIIKEKAKSGHRIGYNLDKYIDSTLNEFESDVCDDSEAVECKKEEKRENPLDNPVKEPNCDENQDAEPNHVRDVSKQQDIVNFENVRNCDSSNDVHKSDTIFKGDAKANSTESCMNKVYRESSESQVCSRWSPETLSYDEDDELQASPDEDKELEEQQALSFRAKLFAFENLAKPAENNSILPKSINKKQFGMKQEDKAVKEKTDVKNNERLQHPHTARDPAPTPCRQLPQQQQQQQQQTRNNKFSEQEKTENCGENRGDKSHEDREFIRVLERSTKPEKSFPRVTKSVESRESQADSQRTPQEMTFQYDQQQYYLLDENCSDMSTLSGDNTDPFYSSVTQQQNTMITQQMHVNQEQPTPPILHQSLSQQNHFVYHGPKHNDNLPQRNQVNLEQEFQRPSKPLVQPREVPSTVCTSQLMERPQFSYSQAGYGKPLSALQQSSSYNMNHWIIQEAELRRQLAASNQYPPKPAPRVGKPAPPPPPESDGDNHLYENSPLLAQMFQKPEQKQQKRMLSVSGRKKCSSCGDELGRGCAAMVIESLSLYYHINCFRCSVCHIQLGNGTCGTDVRVRNHKLHCKNCYSNDEAGLKFSRV